MLKKILFSLVLSGILSFAIAAVILWNLLQEPTQPLQQNLLVPKGVGVSWIANELEQQGVIKNALLFQALTKFKGQENQLKAGEYDLNESLTMPELLDKLTSGDVIYNQVTLIEGWSFKQFKEHLIKQTKLEKELAELSDSEIMQRMGAEKLHPEGQFAPDTYQYQLGDSDLDVLKQSYLNMQNLLDETWSKRQPSKHIKTRQQALILASIIEKETGQASERTTISGVFHNRLRIGMKLQTDPTVIYGMGDKYKGNIKRIHLRTDTPYNTYTRYGLPPTPIAMPGRASIEAALNPVETDALYFVGKGDGSHYFSKTLKQHNRAVARYQLGK